MPDYKCTACEHFFDPDYMHDEVTCRECEIKSLRARVAELEAEKAELVKDRERLDWLNTADNGAYHCDILWRAIDSGTFVPDPVRERPNIRQAIDAAREGE